MQHTIKWWGDGEKPVGIEYRSLSPFEIEPIIRDLMDNARARLIEIRDHQDNLVARYPDAKIHRVPARR